MPITRMCYILIACFWLLGRIFIISDSIRHQNWQNGGKKSTIGKPKRIAVDDEMFIYSWS